MKDRKPIKAEQTAHPPFKFAQFFDSEASWDKETRCIGFAIPLVGGIWILLFLAISSTLVYGYYSVILKVDVEDFGGHGTLLMEGLFASFSLFLLSWVVVYSLGHF